MDEKPKYRLIATFSLGDDCWAAFALKPYWRFVGFTNMKLTGIDRSLTLPKVEVDPRDFAGYPNVEKV